MMNISLRPGEPERDFKQLSAWFSVMEDEPTSEEGLKEYYEKNKERITQMVAEDGQGELQGFYWLIRDKHFPGRYHLSLYARPELRRHGVGGQLYENMELAAREVGAKTLHARIWDNCPEDNEFAERRGFTELRHQMAMTLNLDAFDDNPYEMTITRLRNEGFKFTSMEALGNSEEAQRNLYILNNATAMDIPGKNNEPAWDSFEDFQRSVCQAEWYRPGGQMVAIDTANGAWAALSAITRLPGTDYAYNLHTGVDRGYRGRKLGQAVKVTALRYARDVLKMHTVRTHHDTKNLPMIAIDRKFGYFQIPGFFLLEKNL